MILGDVSQPPYIRLGHGVSLVLTAGLPFTSREPKSVPRSLGLLGTAADETMDMKAPVAATAGHVLKRHDNFDGALEFRFQATGYATIEPVAWGRLTPRLFFNVVPEIEAEGACRSRCDDRLSENAETRRIGELIPDRRRPVRYRPEFVRPVILTPEPTRSISTGRYRD
jgi:hypothetical protein